MKAFGRCRRTFAVEHVKNPGTKLGNGAAARLVVMAQVMGQFVSERKALFRFVIVRVEEDEAAAAVGKEAGAQGAITLSGQRSDPLIA